MLSGMRRAVVVSVTVIAVALSTGRAAAVAARESEPVGNPDLVAACGLDIHIVLDESGSVGDYAGDVRRAFNAFTSALNNTGSRIAVSEFSTVADLPLSGAARNTYTVVTDATRASIVRALHRQRLSAETGGTNWEDGLRMGRYFLPRPSAQQPHLTVFITDGDPNEIIRDTRQHDRLRDQGPAEHAARSSRCTTATRPRTRPSRTRTPSRGRGRTSSRSPSAPGSAASRRWTGSSTCPAPMCSPASARSTSRPTTSIAWRTSRARGGAARGRVPAVRAVGHGAQVRRPHARPGHGRPRSRPRTGT